MREGEEGDRAGSGMTTHAWEAARLVGIASIWEETALHKVLEPSRGVRVDAAHFVQHHPHQVSRRGVGRVVELQAPPLLPEDHLLRSDQRPKRSVHVNTSLVGIEGWRHQAGGQGTRSGHRAADVGAETKGHGQGARAPFSERQGANLGCLASGETGDVQLTPWAGDAGRREPLANEEGGALASLGFRPPPLTRL